MSPDQPVIKSSVFHSLKARFVFLRFSSSAFLCGALDYIGFASIYFFTGNILLSEFFTRTLTALINFQLNKRIVFKSQTNTVQALIKYIVLAVLNVFISYYFIQFLHDLGLSAYLSKIIALPLLFLINFFIQKVLIFRKD